MQNEKEKVAFGSILASGALTLGKVLAGMQKAVGVAGLDAPEDGTVTVDDREVSRFTDAEMTDFRRSTVGFVFQSFGLLPLLSAHENIELALRIAGALYLIWLAWKIANSGPAGEGKARPAPMTFLGAAAFQWVNPKAWAMALTAVTAYGGLGVWVITAVFVAIGGAYLFSWLSSRIGNISAIAIAIGAENFRALLAGAQRLLLQLCGWLQARHAGVLAFTLAWEHDSMRARDVAPGGALFVAMDSTADIVDSSFNANIAGDLSHQQMRRSRPVSGRVLSTQVLSYLKRL